MLRIWLSVVVLFLLAACSSVPQKTARTTSGMTITTPRAFPPPRGFPNFVDHSVGREEISIQAMSLVGIPYRWGGNTPDSGFDCSGLVRYVVGRAADVALPRTTADMSQRGDTIEPDGIAPGDLIFFNTTGRPHSHVGIYVGKLRFVNAPSTGGTVRLDYLTNPYWAKRFDGIRRVAPPRDKATPFDAPTYETRQSSEPVPAPRVAPAQAVYPVTPVAVAAAPTPAPSSARPAAMATAQSDPFEPPPPGLNAAQQQARAAGAVAPTLTAAPAAEVSAPAAVPSDPITAAADAFEPPPPTARAAARQAQLAAPGGVQILRASTAPGSASPAATSTNDDPIARFATGGSD